MIAIEMTSTLLINLLQAFGKTEFCVLPAPLPLKFKNLEGLFPRFMLITF